ncbi:MAG: PAS domain S-box protein, partial [Anaerolineales bacterium]
MKAVRKTTKPIGRGKSKTQKPSPTHKAVKPKPHEKKTEHNQEDESVRQSRDFLLALSRAAQSVQRARTPDDIYRAVGEQIKALDLDATVLTFGTDRQHLLVSYTTYAAQIIRASEKIVGFSTRDYRLPISPESFYGRIIAAEKAEYVHSTGDIVAKALPKVLRPLVGQLMRVLKIDQSIMAPLHMDGVVLGMLGISGSGLSHEDVPAVETFAAQVAISLLNARLAQQAQEELEERKQAEKDLRESEERFRALIENASDMILAITAEGNLNYVSPAALRNTGYKADEVIGRNIVEFIHADDLPLALQALASRSQISGLAPAPIELRFRHKDGMWRIAEILGNNLLDNPLVKGIVLNVRDITEHKQAEEELTIANQELAFQNEEKEKRATELILANKELTFQNDEKEKRATELILANQELTFQNEEKEKRAAELVVANQELAFQNEEKEKRAAELILANQELAFQNEEKEKRATELILANQELAFQNEEKEKRAAELILANKELAF